MLLPVVTGWTQRTIDIEWINGKASGIVIPRDVTGHYSTKSGDWFIFVYVLNEKTAVLGNCRDEKDAIVFMPLWPLTPGLKYEVRWKDRLLGIVDIPQPELNERPSLQVFPSTDTVPENLLKIYLQFSRPMRGELVYDYITVTRNDADTVDVFLKLTPPLWNEDNTKLTLWIDPGRIKRDLSPNRLLGKPLEKSMHYTLTVSANWKDREGAALSKAVSKIFFVSEADRSSPQPVTWRINVPAAGTTNPLSIDFGEALDHSLAGEALSVRFGHVRLNGTVQLGNREREWHFVPDSAWLPGEYSVVVEDRLEDLAGNNLVRLFDMDLEQVSAGREEIVNRRTFFINVDK